MLLAKHTKASLQHLLLELARSRPITLQVQSRGQIAHCRQATWMLLPQHTTPCLQPLFPKFPPSPQPAAPSAVVPAGPQVAPGCPAYPASRRAHLPPSGCPDVSRLASEGVSLVPAPGAFLLPPNRLACTASGPVRPSPSACLDAPRQADD